MKLIAGTWASMAKNEIEEDVLDLGEEGMMDLGEEALSQGESVDMSNLASKTLEARKDAYKNIEELAWLDSFITFRIDLS